MNFADINSVTIHYEFKKTRTDKPVLIFINSLGTDLRIWDDVRNRLGDEISTLVYDKRGHGLSDIGNTPYSIEILANDLIALTDQLSIKKAVICGLSVGGLIAQGVYAARPELVRGLILSNTAHKIGSADMWNARIDAITNDGLKSILDTTMPRWFTDAYRQPDNPTYRAYCNMFVRQPVEGYTATCAALRDADFTQTATSITVPVMCIAADQDGSTPPALVRDLASLVPNAEMLEISDSGHIPCIEQPDIYAGLIRRFMANTF
ncbi:3-oxoadipate enol-lactonase [Brucellaceae bacterium C25G]